MKILYIDAPMGISGDMFLGALIDLDIDVRFIRRELKKLPIDKGEYTVRTAREVRHSITGTTFKVRTKETHHHRTFRDIKRLIRGSDLSKRVKDLSTGIFKTIAEAEAVVHGISPDRVHFHEVGAVDSIVDIVGAAVAVDHLGVDELISSPLPLGSGWADTMHGRIPIPAPATMEILKGVPVESGEAPFELTTPTGAAIVKTLARGFGPMPDMIMEAVGYGAGKKDFPGAANVLRVVLGHTADRLPETGTSVIETNLDDMSPQIAGYLVERLLTAGALEAYFTPVQMKKSRPGVLLTVLVTENKREAILDTLFNESTTIGVRGWPVERWCLKRKITKVKTPYGQVRVKVSYHQGRAVNVQPEYEDCRARALKKKAPLKVVIDAAKAAAKNIQTPDICH